MVGIVIVSHSKALAEAIKTLVTELCPQEVPIAIAAGIDDPVNPFGTDAVKISEAIQSLDTSEGIIVLMDIGSAILSSEMALDFLSDEQRVSVRLCEAPLVEGTIAAVISSGGGKTLDEVLNEASLATVMKNKQLKGDNLIASTIEEKIPSSLKEKRFTISDRFGIHARPAAQLVRTASQFHSKIYIRNLTTNSNYVNAKSINSIMVLGVRQHHEISVSARGPDEDEALRAINDSIIRYLNGQPIMEEHTSYSIVETNLPSMRWTQDSWMSGTIVSKGIAIGPAKVILPRKEYNYSEQVAAPEDEWQHLMSVLEITKNEIKELHSSLIEKSDLEEASIFDAHLLILEDPALLQMLRCKIFDEHVNAEKAWKECTDDTAKQYNAIEDTYIRSRVKDIQDIQTQVLSKLTDKDKLFIQLINPVILIANDLTPYDIARLDKHNLLGICTSHGSVTSHAAILARALGIPMITGLGEQILSIENGTQLVLDANQNMMIINPSKIEKYRNQRTALEKHRRMMENKSHHPAITIDGHRISVLANINNIDDAATAFRLGAEGVGLLRTEFLFENRFEAPTEDEQLAIYENIVEHVGSHPLVIRTLDTGGDKQIPYLEIPLEANPFLGERGIRVYRENDEILRTQIKAILRIRNNANVKIMFPMISSIEELNHAKRVLHDSKNELVNRGIAYNNEIPMGIMIEVPSAAILADIFAKEIDFFSIGTNDLSQYITATDRGNLKVAHLGDAMHPAVLRTIQQVTDTAHMMEVPVALCGEIAGDVQALPVLLGIGIDELSVTPSMIPEIKYRIRHTRISSSRQLVQELLMKESAEAVRDYLNNYTSTSTGL